VREQVRELEQSANSAWKDRLAQTPGKMKKTLLVTLTALTKLQTAMFHTQLVAIVAALEVEVENMFWTNVLEEKAS